MLNPEIEKEIVDDRKRLSGIYGSDKSWYSASTDGLHQPKRGIFNDGWRERFRDPLNRTIPSTLIPSLRTASYFRDPDNKGISDKLLVCGSTGSYVGFWAGCVQMYQNLRIIYPEHRQVHYVNYASVFGHVAKTTFMGATLGGTYAVVTCLSADLRGKNDDGLNQLSAGIATGLLFGLYTRNFAIGYTTAIVSSIVGAGFRQWLPAGLTAKDSSLLYRRNAGQLFFQNPRAFRQTETYVEEQRELGRWKDIDENDEYRKKHDLPPQRYQRPAKHPSFTGGTVKAAKEELENARWGPKEPIIYPDE